MVCYIVQWDLPDQKANLTIYSNKAKNDWLPMTLAAPGVKEIRNLRNPLEVSPPGRHPDRVRISPGVGGLHRIAGLHPDHARAEDSRLHQLQRADLVPVPLLPGVAQAGRLV